MVLSKKTVSGAFFGGILFFAVMFYWWMSSQNHPDSPAVPHEPNRVLTDSSDVQQADSARVAKTPNTAVESNTDHAKALEDSPVHGGPYSKLRAKIHDVKIDETIGNDLLTALGRKNVGWLAEDLATITKDPRFATRWKNYCIQHLALHYIKHRDDTSWNALLEASKFDNDELQSVAVFSFSRIVLKGKWGPGTAQHATSIDILRSRLSSRSHPNVRIAAIRGLGIVKDRETVPKLNEIAKDESNPQRVRAAAIDVLGLLRSESSIALLESLRNEKSKGLRKAVLRALSRIQKEKPASATLPIGGMETVSETSNDIQ